MNEIIERCIDDAQTLGFSVVVSKSRIGGFRLKDARAERTPEELAKAARIANELFFQTADPVVVAEVHVPGYTTGYEYTDEDYANGRVDGVHG